MTHRRWLVASLAAVLLLGVGGYWFLSPAAPPASPGEATAPSVKTGLPAAPGEAPAALPAPRGARLWVPGSQFLYTLATEQRVTFEAQGKGPAPSIQLSLQGELSMAVVALLADRVDLQFQIRATSFSFMADGRDALDEQTRPRMLAHLQAPFYVTFNRQGAALLAHFEREVDPMTQNLLRSLVSSTQFVTPAEARETWPAQELDITGLYMATYRAVPGTRRYEKSKDYYLRLSSPGGLKPVDASTRITLDSKASFNLGEEGWPQSLSSRERVAVAAGEGIPVALGEAQVQLTWIASRRVPLLIGSLETRRQFLGTTSLATQVYAAEDPKEALRRIVKGARLQDLVDELRKLPTDEKTRGPATSQLMSRLRALFTLEPAEAARIPGLLRGEKDRNTYSSLIGSLSAASTPEALQALGQVVADSQLPVAVRVDAAAALGMAETPTEESLTALRQLAKSPEPDLHNTATLALGNAARNLGTQEGSGGEALLKELTDSVRAAPTPEARALQLRALANSANPLALPTIQEALRDPSPLVREAAVEALRLIPEPAADQLLAASMLGDPSPEVRRAAIFASSFRPLTPLLPALQQALRTDAVDAVRMDVVRLLGTNLTSLPSAVDLLTWAGQNDPSSDVRHTALALLAPRTVTPSPGQLVGGDSEKP